MITRTKFHQNLLQNETILMSFEDLTTLYGTSFGKIEEKKRLFLSLSLLFRNGQSVLLTNKRKQITVQRV